MTARQRSTTGCPISVNATPFDLIVFDFDGTLVQSAMVKRRAFFEIFPDHCAPAVEAVLTRDPDGSRFSVIPQMLAECSARGFDAGTANETRLLEAFAERVAHGVANAPEVPGAISALRKAGEAGAVYIFSMTPHDELLRQIETRGWAGLVREAWGFPNLKPQTLAMLLARHDCVPQRAIVIGDGESDERAARENGTRFLRADVGWPQILTGELGT
jgi:phosphoglycolate phosphatase